MITKDLELFNSILQRIEEKGEAPEEEYHNELKKLFPEISKIEGCGQFDNEMPLLDIAGFYDGKFDSFYLQGDTSYLLYMELTNSSHVNIETIKLIQEAMVQANTNDNYSVHLTHEYNYIGFQYHCIITKTEAYFNFKSDDEKAEKAFFQ